MTNTPPTTNSAGGERYIPRSNIVASNDPFKREEQFIYVAQQLNGQADINTPEEHLAKPEQLRKEYHQYYGY